MTKLNRTLFQIFLWAAVWIILGLNQREIMHFFSENWLAYLLQAVLIIILTYQLAPKFLFKKKHLAFTFISLGALIVSAFISISIMNPHNDGRIRRQRPEMELPPPPPGEGPGRGNLHGSQQNSLPPPVLINFLMLSVSYILAIFLETFSFAQKKEEDLMLSKTENIENELKFLKSQINPHFLFNSLNNIYSLSMIDSNKAQQSILYLSDMLRYVLYECEKPMVVIEKEVTYIKDFIQLFLLKSSKKYPVETKFFIENKGIQIAPMLLIPFVENAFKHSNIEKIEEAFIKICIHSSGSTILFSVENTFRKGPKVQDAVGGIGIQNVKKRLNLLYPDKHTLVISEINSTFKVELKIETNA
ncbi:hypothetical protein FFWV33_02605 [Flavobacterium faecale]|uniref:Signal transduction histidine kinase internal region domain-containing protein n=1 Tax=Flavobacterium faecale TaxID=1355330 RepID=A0A2S1LAB7_9FLAO|nr:histidine kinase [Flavobacterium faecale]AWG20496.1 hypothetical protein FFWV33_02605 [Flavobacterium faecale]